MINAGGIPQKNDVLNQVYANVLGRPVLVPSKSVVSLGSAIFAFLAAGTFKTVEEAQDKICPSHRRFLPEDSAQHTYDELYPSYSRLYFALGQRGNERSGRYSADIDQRGRVCGEGPNDKNETRQ